ncbi:MAG: hypothetical protein HC814_07165 [Rhodobacteraceae bacterium]|nr:hypothetical protein [Paracoccaceae bacterium]
MEPSNAFKLVGAEANAVAPGKRPLSSMSPTIVTKDGEPIIAIGAPAGRRSSPKHCSHSLTCSITGCRWTRRWPRRAGIISGAPTS